MAVDLPGIAGKDYHFISFHGEIFVVYNVAIPGGGGNINMTFRISDADKKAFLPAGAQIHQVTGAQFGGLQHFGDVSEIIKRGDTRHPFQQYLSHLEELYGNISWIHDKGFMGTMLSGFVKGWSSSEIQQALTRTSWYQQRTDAQRNWITLSAAERQTRIGATQEDMKTQLEQIYGPNVPWQDHFAEGDLRDQALRVASGDLGDPSQGLQSWLQRRTMDAAQIEGTQAWADQQQRGRSIAAVANAPEDMFQQIKAQAAQWLGPNAVPPDDALRKWANDLVSGTKAQGDWEQFMQNRSQSLYPYLAPNEQWQDRAGAYKAMAEQQFGTPIGFDDPLLQRIGQVDSAGKPTGAAVSSTDFQQQVRQDPRFWKSQTAQQQGFSLLSGLNQMFNGVA